MFFFRKCWFCSGFHIPLINNLYLCGIKWNHYDERWITAKAARYRMGRLWVQASEVWTTQERLGDRQCVQQHIRWLDCIGRSRGEGREIQDLRYWGRGKCWEVGAGLNWHIALQVEVQCHNFCSQSKVWFWRKNRSCVLYPIVYCQAGLLQQQSWQHVHSQR